MCGSLAVIRARTAEAATVEHHVSSILTQLGLRNRAQLLVFAYESGLVEAGDHNIGH